MAQLDAFSATRFVFSSFFANFAVVAILCGMVVMAFGTAWSVVKRDAGIKVFAYGAVLVGIFAALTAQQFGAVPVSFGGVGKLGLATLPAGPVMAAYNTAMSYIMAAIGWAASVMGGIGGLMLLCRSRGAMHYLLVGAVMGGIGMLVGSGGIVGVIMGFVGVHVPVVA